MQSTDIDRSFQEYVATGSPRALARVFDAVAGELLLLAGHLTADPHAAEDLVQATFLAAIRGREDYRREAGVKSWLVGILSNQARMEFRRLRRRLDPSRLRVEPSIEPDVEVELREFTAALQEAMAGLPARYREVLRLGLLHGLTVQEIASAVGRPRETVKTQLRRGLEQLRQALPTSLAFSTALAMTPGRGLAAIRDQVLGQADPSGLAADGTIEGGGRGAAEGALRTGGSGLGVTPATAAAAVLLMAAGFGWWQVARQEEPQPEAIASRPAAAAGPELPETTSPDTTLARRVLADPRLASTTGSLKVLVRFARAAVPAEATAEKVVVCAVPAGDTSWLREQRATCDATGTARFDSFPVGPVKLRGGQGGTTTAVVQAGRTATIGLSIPPGLMVQGRVLDKAGHPVADARVWLSPPGQCLDQGVTVTRSAADGSYQIADVTPGCTLTAFAGARFNPMPRALTGAPGERVALDLQFRGLGGVVHGVVRGPDGRPLAGAAVLVGWNIDPEAGVVMPAFRLRTGADGSFHCGGLPTLLHIPIWARAPGTAVSLVRVAPVPAGDSSFVPIQLAGGVSVRGQVTGTDGAPAEGIRVEAENANAPADSGHGFRGPDWAITATHTDADGRYALHGLNPGTVVLRATDGRFAAATGRCELTSDRPGTFDAQLTETVHSVQGRLCDSQGRSLVGYGVWIGFLDAGIPPVHLVSDAEGRFTAHVRRAGRYELRVTRRPQAAASDRRGTVPTAGCIDIFEGSTRAAERQFVVDAAADGGTITARIQGTDGTPVRRGMVSLVNEKPTRVGVRSEPVELRDGKLRVDALRPGAYAVYFGNEEIGHGLYLGRAQVEDGATVDLGDHQFHPPGRLDLRVLDPDGKPSAMAIIELARPEGPMAITVPLTAGRALTPPLQPGAWFVKAWHHNHVPVDQRIVVTPGDPQKVVVPFAAGERVELHYPPVPGHGMAVRFRLWALEPHSTFGERPALVSATAAPPGVPIYCGLHWISAQVRRETVSLRPGRYRLDVATAGGTATGSTFVVAPGTPNRIQIEFP